MRVTCIAQHLDGSIFHATDILLRLAALRLGNPQTNEAVPEVALDPKTALVRSLIYELRKARNVSHGDYLA